MSSILLLLVVLGGILVADRAAAVDHVRFADVDLSAEVSQSLLHVGRALTSDAAAERVIEHFPDLRIVVLDSHLPAGPNKLRWRDARVEPEIARYYAVAGWLTTTLELYLPTGYVPFRERPLMNLDVLLLRDYVPPNVLLSGALKHAIAHELKAVPGRRGFVETQDAAFDAIDLQESDADVVARLTLATLRLSSLQEVDVVEWMLAHRHDLAFSTRTQKKLIDHAAKNLAAVAKELAKSQAAARPGAVDRELAWIRDQMRDVAGNFRAVACQLLL